MKQTITITISNNENVGTLNEAQIKSIQEIVTVLITTGSCTGIKGGAVLIHFDGDGIFQGVSHDYWPWRRRRKGV